MGVVYFIILVGALIFVHELGHFLVAKLFGVRVLKFSVGFGPAIAGFRAGGTHYVLGLIPIGGYVRMWGEQEDDKRRDKPQTEEERQAEREGFRGQPLWAQALIVLAGPIMNLVLPLFLFFVVFFGDSMLTPPIVGTVFPGRPADGLLFTGDEIVSIDGDPISTFEELKNEVRGRPGQPIELRVRRDEQLVDVTLTPAATVRRLELDRTEEVGRLGIDPYQRTAVVGVLPGSAAYLAGLRSFDIIVSVQGEVIDDYEDLARTLEHAPSLMSVTYLRPERETALDGLIDISTFTPHVANINPASGRAPGTARVGVEPADLYIHSVELDSPEARMGLQPGDRIVTLDGAAVRLWPTFVADLRASPSEPHELTWRRSNELYQGTLRLGQRRGTTVDGQRFERTHLAINTWMPLRVGEGVENPNRFTHAARRAWEETKEMVSLTVTSVLRLFQGRVGVQTIGGPLMMFDAAGQAAQDGATNYLKLMAFISVNLGLLNLLPIPLLDGGHLMFLLIETTTRRRIGRRVRRVASLIGFVLLVFLMGLALKNDVDRLYPSSASATQDIP